MQKCARERCTKGKGVQRVQYVQCSQSPTRDQTHHTGFQIPVHKQTGSGSPHRRNRNDAMLLLTASVQQPTED